MKKKLKIILGIIIVCIILLFITYKVGSRKETEERMARITAELMDYISSQDYEKIKNCIRYVDGRELSDQEITNFLLNTGLYRSIMVHDENTIFTYSSKINFFETNKGNIIFSFTALNGEIITNELSYINTGIEEYLMTDKTQESNKEKEKFSMALDLADGTTMRYNENTYDDLGKNLIVSFIKEGNDNISVEIIKEAEEDFKLNTINMMNEEINDLKDFNEGYNIEWDDEYKEFSVYYDKNANKKVVDIFTKMRIMITSILMQVLNGNENWKLTINYYDYITKELIGTEIIR